MARTNSVLKGARWFPVGISALWMAGCSKSEVEVPRAPEPVTVRANVLTLEPGAISTSYEASGVVKASLDSILASKAVGTVTSVSVREGDSVKSGEILLSIDDRELAAASASSLAAVQSARAGVDRAQTSAEVEIRTSQTRIAQAEAMLNQALANQGAAIARRDVVQQGPRKQELTQAHLAVEEATSNLKLAEIELERAKRLAAEEAISRRELDVAQNRYEVAKSHRESAAQAENMAMEGSRTQEIRAAQEEVSRARAVVAQARAAVVQAKTDALQSQIRQKDVEVARALHEQAIASMHASEVGLSYAKVAAPFSGKVVHRSVDPGSMATIGSPLVKIEGGDYRLEISVPESLLGKLSSRQMLPVEIGEKRLTGTVVEIVPQGDANTHTYVAKLSIGSHAWIRSGMFGKAFLPTPSASGIAIPASATWEREGLHYAFVLDERGIARLRIITLGKRSGNRIEVLSGLASGEKIVADHADSIRDGEKIEASNL